MANWERVGTGGSTGSGGRGDGVERESVGGDGWNWGPRGVWYINLVQWNVLEFMKVILL